MAASARDQIGRWSIVIEVVVQIQGGVATMVAKAMVDSGMLMEAACFRLRDCDRGRRSSPELLGMLSHVIRPGAGGGVCGARRSVNSELHLRCARPGEEAPVIRLGGN